jgi:hypothetical protein
LTIAVEATTRRAINAGFVVLFPHALEGVDVMVYAVLAGNNATASDGQTAEVEALWANGTDGGWETIATRANV